MTRFSIILKVIVALIMTSGNLYAASGMIEGINYGFEGDYASVIRSDSEYEGKIDIPSEVTYLGKTYIVKGININAFRNCINMTSVTIPNSVTGIGFCAFAGCSGLTSVTIPRSVTSIGESAFDGCSHLSTVHITDLGAWCRIHFDSQSSNPLIYAHHLFLNGEEINVLEIPKSVMSINYPTFCCFSGFTSVFIPRNVISIGSEAFKDCIGLTSITISNSVTSIGNFAFSGCSGLTTVVSEIEKPYKIDYSVFNGIPSNAQLVVPKGTKAAYQVTEGWNQFTNIVEAGDDSTISGQCGDNVYYSYDKTTHTLTIYGEGDMWSYDDSLIEPNDDNRPWFSYLNDIINLRIESGVTIIGRCAFDGCENLTSVSISSSVTTFDWRAFAGCSSLPSIIMPNNLTSIKMGAFSDCRSLISILIPKNVTFLDDSAFEGCSNLASITVEDGNLYFDSRNNCNAIIEKSSNTLIVGCKNTIIPNSVISIGTSAFYGRDGLTSMTIPSSVTSIGSGAFYNCGLTTIVSEIENPFEISSWTFSDDTYNVATLVVPRGTKAAYQATEGWNRFTKIVEAGDDPTISGQCGDNVHYSYDRTTHTLTINGDGPMYSMDMEDYYPWWSFSNDIQHVKIESGVTSIGYSAFSQSGLTSITIPNSVTSIGDYAFNACHNLSSIISEIEYPFEIAKEVWGDLLYIRSDVQLLVPKGTKAAYQATEGWNQFTNIVEAGGTEPDQPGQIHNNDIIFKVTGSGEAEVVSVDNGITSITIPSTVSHNNNSYKVTAIAKDAFENCEHLAAVIWEPEVQFNTKVNNPNLLLYVTDDKYASRSVKNVVVNGVAESIELTDAASGNDFYCPRAFRARSIVYSHNYQMETGIGDSRGWETIVLPFDVQKYTHATKGELESFTTWSKGSNKKPFWLFELTASGYKDVAGIKANTPYIISMPNNKQYEQQYQIPGIVTFSAENVEVQKSDNLTPASYQTRKFVPNYANKEGDDLLPLNVSNNYVTNPGKEINGSKFVRGLRAVHPFEAYMTTTDNTRTIDVMEGLSTAIKDIRIVENEASVIKVYDTKGVLLKTATSMDDARAGLKAGVYIVNGKKMIIK